MEKIFKKFFFKNKKMSGGLKNEFKKPYGFTPLNPAKPEFHRGRNYLTGFTRSLPIILAGIFILSGAVFAAKFIGYETSLPGFKIDDNLNVTGNTVISGSASIGGNTEIKGEVKSTVSGVEFYMVPRGAIIMWSGALASIPAGWALCDGTNGTPNLRNRFVFGVEPGEEPGTTGGLWEHKHDVPHKHTIDPPETRTGLPDLPDEIRRGDKGTRYPAGMAHSHAVDIAPFSSSEESPETTISSNLPPYFRLAFIMKL